MAFGTGGAIGGVVKNSDLKMDIELTQGPDDSVSGMRFSPQADFLAVSSWDKKTRIYEVTGQGQTIGKAMYEHESPVLCCDWSKVSG